LLVRSDLVRLNDETDLYDLLYGITNDRIKHMSFCVSLCITNFGTWTGNEKPRQLNELTGLFWLRG
jgi:hypothetical protein